MNVTYYYGSTVPIELQIMHAQVRSHSLFLLLLLLLLLLVLILSQSVGK